MKIARPSVLIPFMATSDHTNSSRGGGPKLEFGLSVNVNYVRYSFRPMYKRNDMDGRCA
jgi:hypothetical protein